ncbi:LacI family DNA-binding transcriptional regulator [Anaerosporobacter sp.]|uniref:LacI family DNA-binding transcriptional regulator n=1 Tax=Anaerosporobacter sp. TaxID=1872529 RepID=UPI00286F9AAE|nr:LacI family DNA-binding transcriptional regulator [Anaerosporobacter sp.]
MATIKDIAAYTGVSCTTVSNVIHGRSTRVSPETESKIQEAIKTLGYIPNMSARALVSNSSKVVALINHIVTDKEQNFMDDPFQATFVGIIESVLREHGYYLMVRTVETSDELLAFLQTWNVDGLFITGMFRDSFFDALTDLKLPIIFIDSYVHHPNFCNVGLEDFKGSYQATKYMIEHGHKHIAFASPSIKDGGVLQERFLGYKSALTEAGIPFNKDIVFQYEMDLDSCQQLSDKLIEYPQVTAIITTADIMAAGIITGLRNNGIRVPEDISIMGFDDLYISQIITPTLTTIHQDMQLKGNVAVDFMVQKLEGKTLSQTEIVLPIHLVERNSVRTL